MHRNLRFYERLAIAEEMAAHRSVTAGARERHALLAKQYREKLQQVAAAAPLASAEA